MKFIFEKSPAKKEMCPECQQKGTFRMYEGLPRKYGKCERINECGHFVDPHKEPLEIQKELMNEVATEIKKPKKEPELIFPTKDEIKALVSLKTSNFHHYINESKVVPLEHLTKWLVGTNSYGNTAFIIANKKTYFNAKFMKYGDKLKRDKQGIPYYMKAAKDKKYTRCIYGEHLLSDDLSRVVCLVESEKTAILAAYYYPEFDWLATGGNNGMTSEMIPALFNRTIYYLCDSDLAGRTSSTLKKLKEYKQDYHLVDLFPDRNDGYDLADFILEEYPKTKTLPEIKPEKDKPNQDDYDLYQIPKEVTEPLENLLSSIKNYRMFQANNKVYMMNDKTYPYTFYPVTNFEISIIQHMQDEKFPKKLIWMKNTFGKDVIFDILSSDINSPSGFENMVTNQGKFYFTGSRKDHQTLKIYLFDKMGTGRMIETIGWQPEGFWVWNNQVNVPGTTPEKSTTIQIDGNGVFKYKDTSYYVPSANRVYANNLYKYEAQKKVNFRKVETTFLDYTSQMKKVHRNHAITGILFTISSMFQDIVVNELGFFPMMFLFGPASSGKDQLSECMQSFFGKPQTALNLEGGVSTIKAQVREFAQFSNLISHLSEYKNGDPQLDGVLKGLWDRRGYKRGNIDSHVGTESIPILSSVLMTGNYAPDQEALVTRLIWNFMDKTSFSDEEIKEYETLADMTKKGVSGLTEFFINNRTLVESKFKAVHREYKATLGARLPNANSRMITNLSVLGSFYQIFSNIVSFPFTADEMLTHFYKTIEKQMLKLDSASIINKFWECFLAGMRTGQPEEKIQINRDYKIEGNELYFNFTNCFNRIQRQWYAQYKEGAPAKSLMAAELKKDRSFIEIVKATRMSSGRDGVSTSAYIVRLNEISIGAEILSNMQFQSQEVPNDDSLNEIINERNGKVKVIENKLPL
jgi:hypothetical protein